MLDGQSWYESSIAVARAHDDRRTLAEALDYLGILLSFKQETTAALECLQSSLALAQAEGDEWQVAIALWHEGLAYKRRDTDIERGQELLEQAAAKFAELGDIFHISILFRHISWLAMERGELTRARTQVQKALAAARQVGSKYEIASNLWALAECAHREQQPERALLLLLAGKNVFESIGAWAENYQQGFEDDLAKFRIGLDDGTLTAVSAQVSAMTAEQATAYALEED